MSSRVLRRISIASIKQFLYIFTFKCAVIKYIFQPIQYIITMQCKHTKQDDVCIHVNVYDALVCLCTNITLSIDL